MPPRASGTPRDSAFSLLFFSLQTAVESQISDRKLNQLPNCAAESFWNAPRLGIQPFFVSLQSAVEPQFSDRKLNQLPNCAVESFWNAPRLVIQPFVCFIADCRRIADHRSKTESATELCRRELLERPGARHSAFFYFHYRLP